MTLPRSRQLLDNDTVAAWIFLTPALIFLSFTAASFYIHRY